MVRASIIIPVYNVEAYLRQCLDSVVNQTLKDFEVVCVDDGSADGSPAILAEYAAKDPRVKVVAQERSTAGVACNVGLSVARGKYVAFFDSDDFMAPNAFAELYELAELNKTEIVVSGVTRYAADGKRVLAEQQFDCCTRGLNLVFAGKDLVDSIFTTFLPAPWNKFYLAEFVRSNNLEFQNLPRCNDLCFTLTAFACAKRIAILSRTCYCHRQGVIGSSQNTSDDDPLCVCRAYFELMNQLKIRGLYERHAASSILYTFKEFLLYELSFWRDLAVARAAEMRMLQFQTKRREQELGDEIDELHKSFAYRVGMLATWRARRVYRMFRGCLKRGENRADNLNVEKNALAGSLP